MCLQSFQMCFQSWSNVFAEPVFNIVLMIWLQHLKIFYGSNFWKSQIQNVL